MWTRVDQFIKGTYAGIAYAGIVSNSRVRYGGGVRHTVDLVEPITVFGEDRYTILVDEEDDFVVDIEDVFAY
jgi:hypothetical protein